MQNQKVLPIAKKKALLSIRAKFLAESRKWFADNSFTEVQGPIIVPSLGENNFSFSLSYFGGKASLSQGLEPYTDSFIAFFPKFFRSSQYFGQKSQSLTGILQNSGGLNSR